MTHDPSHGYDAAAEAFIEARSAVGRDVVTAWARELPPGGSVLDVGCGHGVPVTEALVEAGLSVWALDASPRLAAACQARFPTVAVACEPVETSAVFDRTFDGVVAVGLVFLLTEAAQRTAIARMAGALEPGGRLLFSAPWRIGEWTDVLTGLRSVSLGLEAYTGLLEAAGVTLINRPVDAGGTHYYAGRRAG